MAAVSNPTPMFPFQASAPTRAFAPAEKSGSCGVLGLGTAGGAGGPSGGTEGVGSEFESEAEGVSDSTTLVSPSVVVADRIGEWYVSVPLP